MTDLTRTNAAQGSRTATSAPVKVSFLPAAAFSPVANRKIVQKTNRSNELASRVQELGGRGGIHESPHVERQRVLHVVVVGVLEEDHDNREDSRDDTGNAAPGDRREDLLETQSRRPSVRRRSPTAPRPQSNRRRHADHRGHVAKRYELHLHRQRLVLLFLGHLLEAGVRFHLMAEDPLPADLLADRRWSPRSPRGSEESSAGSRWAAVAMSRKVFAGSKKTPATRETSLMPESSGSGDMLCSGLI